MKDWLWITAGLSVLWLLNAASLPDPRFRVSGDALESVLQIPASAAPAPLFDRLLGSECADEECSDYESGYQWAEASGIEDPAECSGSESFVAGCSSFATGHDQQWHDRAVAQAVPAQFSSP